MKIIPRFFHGVLDYLSGALLLLAPNLFGFAEVGGAAAWLPRIAGLIIVLQAMMTDYELGLVKVVPIAMHLMADYAIGVVLLVAPFVFGIQDRSIAATGLLVLVAVIALAGAAMTESRGRPRAVTG
jgi:hypothetical protein